MVDQNAFPITKYSLEDYATPDLDTWDALAD